MRFISFELQADEHNHETECMAQVVELKTYIERLQAQDPLLADPMC